MPRAARLAAEVQGQMRRIRRKLFPFFGIVPFCLRSNGKHTAMIFSDDVIRWKLTIHQTQKIKTKDAEQKL